MGIYATNTYNLTIPLDKVGGIMAELRVLCADRYFGDWIDNLLKDETPEGLAQVIADLHGSEGDPIDVTIEGGDVRITGHSYGKVLDYELLEGVLSAAGTTGIIHGEVEGDFFLTEYTGTDVRGHDGQIVYPTYGGGLL